jgi:hypothetical protein
MFFAQEKSVATNGQIPGFLQRRKGPALHADGPFFLFFPLRNSAGSYFQS